MSYKLSGTKQEQLSVEEFNDVLSEIERVFNGNEEKIKKYGISGHKIYVKLGNIFNQPYFVKTTVSDLISIFGNINITWIQRNDFVHKGENCYCYIVNHIEVANPKKMRGILKFTPKNTLLLQRFGCAEQDGKMTILPLISLAMLQDEKFLNAYVDNAFNNDENGCDYDYAMRHAFKILNIDKRFAINPYDNYNYDAMEEASFDVQEVISQYFEYDNSWSVIYNYKDIDFAIPMEREFMGELLKSRERQNGRKRTLPTVIKGYTRKDGTVVSSHIRQADYDCVVDGRKLEFFISGDDIYKIFPDNEYGHKKAKEIIQEYKNTCN